jgi:crotonobetainyl-CoA:carnitine CoA-transferase CaiB-like acyl-CoA transferase
LDLTTGPGRRGLEGLLDTADIVIENYRPRAIEKLGLEAGSLIERHPRLVVVSISSYARGSDREHEGSYDLIAQAETGIMSLTGEEGGAPVRAGVAISDLAAGLWGALGAVAAYAVAIRDDRGRHVEVPLLDSAMSLLSYVATSAMGTGMDPGPVGSGHHNIVPYRAFATADGWVVVAVLGDKFWPLLCDALELEELAAEVDLRINRRRTADRERIDAAVSGALGRLTTEEALRRLATAGVPHAPLNTVLQAVASPYVQQAGMVAEVDSPEGPYRVVQGPLRSGNIVRPAPGLGEHTREVMTEVLGADSADLEALTGQ